MLLTRALHASSGIEGLFCDEVLFNALVNACSSSMIWKDSLELCSEASLTRTLFMIVQDD